MIRLSTTNPKIRADQPKDGSFWPGRCSACLLSVAVHNDIARSETNDLWGQQHGSYLYTEFSDERPSSSSSAPIHPWAIIMALVIEQYHSQSWTCESILALLLKLCNGNSCSTAHLVCLCYVAASMSYLLSHLSRNHSTGLLWHSITYDTDSLQLLEWFCLLLCTLVIRAMTHVPCKSWPPWHVSQNAVVILH